MKNIQIAVALGAMLSFSNLSAEILSYNLNVSGSGWGTILLTPDPTSPLPFGVSEQPNFTGTFKVDTGLPLSSNIIDFKLVTGSQTWTTASLGSTSSLYGYGSNINEYQNLFLQASSGFGLLNFIVAPMANINSMRLMDVSNIVECQNCVSFSLKSSLPPKPPTNYGLFIGAYDPGTSFQNDANFNIAAQRLASAFDARPNSVSYTLLGDLSKSNGAYKDPIALNEIEIALESIRLQMQQGDTLTLYIGGHGGSTGDSWYNQFVGGGEGDEAVRVGNEYLYDNWLAAALFPFSSYQKNVFIDSCHSGGFWGSGDTLELRGSADLDSLSKIALYTSAAESELAYAFKNSNSSDFGIGLFSLALEDAFNQSKSWSINGLGTYLDSRTRYLADWTELQFPDTQFYRLNIGDPVPYDQLSLSVTSRYSDDLDPNTTILSVPEPPTIYIFILAFFIFYRLSQMRICEANRLYLASAQNWH